VIAGIYPVQIYLHSIEVVKPSQCPYCFNKGNKTLTHYACVCPAFQEASTAAHNQVRLILRAVLAVSLKDTLSEPDSEDWDIFEDTPLASTGLKLQEVPIKEA
jgi:hypothetical protein